MAEDTGVKSDSTTTQSSEGGDPEVTVDHTPEAQAKRIKDLAAENKKYRQKASSVESKLEETARKLAAAEEERMKEQGKWQEMYQAEKAKASELEKSSKQDRAKFAYRSVTSQFAQEAAKAGCTKVDDLIKLASADGILNDLEVSGEDFSVAPDSIKAAVETAQKQYPYLYAKMTPAVRDGVPNHNQQTVPAKPDLTSMKMEDLIKLAKSLT